MSMRPNDLLSYRFTLLSNLPLAFVITEEVLLPYRFTLLSNLKHQMQNIRSEKMPYENI